MSSNAQNKVIPQHIAIIMDGNGRWAKLHKKTRIEGHKQGALQVRKVLEGAKKLGVKYLTLYAFSSENWNRPKVEVEALMYLLEASIKTYKKEFLKNKIRFETIGDISTLPVRCQKAITDIKQATADFKDQTLILALNYGSRDEITRAVRQIAEKSSTGVINPREISWQTIAEHLDTSSLPDPDLIIRTSGEIRLSNYLMLQSAYAEFYFTDVNWPDFDEAELEKAVAEFSRRERRYGMTSEQLEK